MLQSVNCERVIIWRKCTSVENLKDMNKYTVDAKRRGRNLLVVEGRHEKDKLFWLIFRCFPEIHVDLNDIWIYGTNIYKLYEDIAKEYGSEWADKGEDIDLPLVISKRRIRRLVFIRMSL